MMRAIPSDLAAELARGVTTLCRCWRATRRDGVAFGFTDHDRDISFGGITFLAHTGLEASEVVSPLGFAVGGGEISGALVSDAILETDIQSGLWDDASIETWLVDWSQPVRRLLIEAGQIGEITRSGKAFTAEIRSLAARFDQEQGRRYEAMCSADLGDGRCGVDMTVASRRIVTTIAVVQDVATFSVSSVPGLLSGSLTAGVAVFQQGTVNEKKLPIMSHTQTGTMEVVSLWNAPMVAMQAGNSVLLQPGCDKRFSTCRDRFANAINFRGFPHIPGNDFLMSYARQGDAELDGGVMVP